MDEISYLIDGVVLCLFALVNEHKLWLVDNEIFDKNFQLLFIEDRIYMADDIDRRRSILGYAFTFGGRMLKVLSIILASI